MIWNSWVSDVWNADGKTEGERLIWNSENGVQAGVATSVFIGADFRGRIQYHGSDSLDRIDDFVFASGRTSRHGLGMHYTGCELRCEEWLLTGCRAGSLRVLSSSASV